LTIVKFGIHLPLIDFGGEGFSLSRLAATVDAARDCGFSSVSANDHFLFSAPWLDGPTALAAIVERSGGMTLATTLSLATLRGPVPLAKTLVALDILSGGRLIAGVGPGSSRLDYEALGVPFEERWKRFEEAVLMLGALLRSGRAPSRGTYYAAPSADLSPGPQRSGGVPMWIGSWGSQTGIRRVARLGDGWMASAYNSTPEQFKANLALLSAELEQQKRPAVDFPNALVTMWTWVTDAPSDAERIISEVLAPMLKRDPAEVGPRVCIGSAEQCAELLSRYVRAGCQEIYFWPVGDQRRQIERIAGEIMPAVEIA
jgi:alkanesulfonate monooxygenase SsuD/methylene tetrahydromethanopterin reductase-like flavin-dependent oxidoreductase (luciferase family)